MKGFIRDSTWQESYKVLFKYGFQREMYNVKPKYISYELHSENYIA